MLISSCMCMIDVLIISIGILIAAKSPCTMHNLPAKIMPAKIR